MSDYKKELRIKELDKLNELLLEMPDYCKQYFNYAIGTRNMSSTTLVAYFYDLRSFYTFLLKANPILTDVKDISLDVLEQLRPMDIEEYLSYCAGPLSNDARTRRRKLAALRSFYHYYYKNGLIKNNPAKLTDGPKKEKVVKPRLDTNEISDLLDGTVTGDALTDRQKIFAKRTRLRDSAIIALFIGTGMRVSELVGIDLDDIDFKHMTVKVNRKGGKEQNIHFGEAVARYLEDYIKFERNAYDDANRALFISYQGERERLTVRSVERIVKKYGKGSVAKNVTPHTLRRSYGTQLYREKNDIYLVSKALGHSEIQVTAEHYMDISNDQLEKLTEFSDKLLD